MRIGAALVLGWAASLAVADEPAPASLPELVEHVQQRVVKLYGGALGMEQGYGSGVIVSSDGEILTTLSVLLETPALRVVLPDGRRMPAEVLRRDPDRQLALLKIDTDGLAAFAVGASESLTTGDTLVSGANPFKVASGPEAVSVCVGVLSGRTSLEARRRTREFEYDGEVLLTDIIISTPGCAGGALVDLSGRLVGLIGKPVTSTRTNTWLNYALPIEACRPLLAGEVAPAGDDTGDEDGRARSLAWGLRLFDVGGSVRLAYVERVTPDSPARRAGVRHGDLVLAVEGTPIETCDDFYGLAAKTGPEAAVELLLKRGEEVLAVTLELLGGSQ